MPTSCKLFWKTESKKRKTSIWSVSSSKLHYPSATSEQEFRAGAGTVLHLTQATLTRSTIIFYNAKKEKPVNNYDLPSIFKTQSDFRNVRKLNECLS